MRSGKPGAPKHSVAAMSVAKAKVQSIVPVYGTSHDAVASKPKAGMVWNIPLFVYHAEAPKERRRIYHAEAAKA
jgi:hypothetical protein